MDPILSNLSTYGGTYWPALLSQIFVNLMDQEITILEDIKGLTKFVKLSVGGGLKPYTGTFSPTDKLNYTDRALNPQLFQYDLLIDPRKYKSNYQATMVGASAQERTIPFENFVWMKVIEELSAEIVQYGLGSGIQGGSNSNAAANIFNGFLTTVAALITGGQAAITTGSITSSNSVAKLEAFYTAAMATNEAWYGKKLNLYVSRAQYNNYIVNYRANFQYDPAIFSNGKSDIFLKINPGMVKLTPVNWLSGSNRIILAPKENLVLGTDKLSDMSAINIIPDVYSLKCGISATIDCNIIDTGAVWYNDQA